MAAQVLSFFQRSPRLAPAPADWSQQELAEFYRVESALIRAGIRVGTDRGLSDENEPWFVFYRADDGEVVIHFARIDGEYIIAGPAYEEIARGFDFTALVRNLVARHPLIRRPDNGSNISIHPAALLVAVVGTAFFKTGEARAAETGATSAPSHSRPALLSSSSSAGLSTVVAAPQAAQPAAYDSVQIPANQAVLILAAAMMASDYRAEPVTVDPVTHSAIAAAAQALDFSGVSSAAIGQDSGAFMSTLHASTIDNGPAQTVSAVLSLVALLSTSSHGDEALSPAAVDVAASASSNGVSHDQALSTLPAQTEAANWAIDVRLGSGQLPSVEAVQLVRGVFGEANFQKISVIEVAKLPDVLVGLIGGGDHYTVTEPTPAPSDPLVTTPTTDHNPPVGGAPTDQTPATGGHDTTGDTGSSTLPTSPSAPVDPQPSAPSTTYATVDIVKQFIDYFLAHTSQIDVMKKDADIVMFDARVMTDVSHIVHLESMTFDFADGSSISLVGDHSAFLHTGTLV